MATCSALFMDRFHSQKMLPKSTKDTFTAQSFKSCCQESADKNTFSSVSSGVSGQNMTTAVNTVSAQSCAVTETKSAWFDVK